MPDSPKVRIVVVGAGLMGRRHIELVRANARCELAAIADPSPSSAEAAALARVPCYGSLDKLLAAQRPDGVIIATPNHLHVEQTLSCVRAGIAVLLEKPAAQTLEEGERLCRAVDDARARVLVGHHRAHSPIVVKAREIVRQGALGNLVAVIGSALFYKPDDYFEEALWRRESGGGPILLNMIHEVGVLRSLCGEIEAVHAFASNATRGFPVEDTVAVNLRFAGGALGTFMLSDCAGSARSWEQTSGENASYPSYPDEDCYVLAGTRGSLAIPSLRMKTYASDEDRSWWKPFHTGVAEVTRADPLERQLAHFCDVIRGHAPPVVSVRDGVENLRVTEAISRSASSGLAVAVRRL